MFKTLRLESYTEWVTQQLSGYEKLEFVKSLEDRVENVDCVWGCMDQEEWKNKLEGINKFYGPRLSQRTDDVWSRDFQNEIVR